MNILRNIANEVALSIKQTFDDKTVTFPQIVYWLIGCANTLKGQHIQKRRSGRFLNIYDNVPVQVLTTGTNPNALEGRKHIVLPADIFDFDLDGGIEYIVYTYKDTKKAGFCRTKFTRTSPSEADVLYMDQYTKPSPKNPYFYVAHNYVYLLGIECVDVPQVEVGLYTLIPDIASIDVDAPFDFPDELLETLKFRVINMARFSYVFPADTAGNKGTDTTEDRTANVPKVVSVNDQQQ